MRKCSEFKISLSNPRCGKIQRVDHEGRERVFLKVKYFKCEFVKCVKCDIEFVTARELYFIVL